MIPRLSVQLIFPAMAVAISLIRDVLVISGDDGQRFFVFISLVNLITTVSAAAFTKVHFSYFSLRAHILFFIVNLCLYLLMTLWANTNSFFLFLSCLIFYFYSLISGYLVSVGHFVVSRFHHVLHTVPFTVMLYSDLDIWTAFFWSVFFGLIFYALYALYAVSLLGIPRIKTSCIKDFDHQGASALCKIIVIAAIPPLLMHGTQWSLFNSASSSLVEIRTLFYGTTIMTLPIGYLVYKKLPGLVLLDRFEILALLCITHFVALLLADSLWLFGFTTVAVSYCVRSLLSRYSDLNV